MSFRSDSSRLLICSVVVLGVAAVAAFAQDEGTPIDVKLPKFEEKSDAATSEEKAKPAVQSGASVKSTASANVDPGLAELEEQANPATLKAIDLYIEGDVDGAYALFKQVYDANPDSDPPGTLIATLHSHAGRFLQMRRALEQSAEEYPTDPEAFLQLAGIDAQEGRYLETELLLERAERLIDEYPKLHPESTSRAAYFREEALTVRANLAERRGRYEAASDLMRKVIELNPKNAQAFWNLGYLAMKQKKYDEAEEAYESAAKLNPELWSGWLQVLSALDREDEIDEAVARLGTKEDKVKGANKKELAQLARLYMRWHKVDDAFNIVHKFEEQNEERDLDRWILSGWLALYANNYAAAETFFRNATLIDPTSFEATNGLALALLDQSNKEKLGQARVIAARNYRANPDSQEAATTYAWCQFLSGNTKEADAIFQPMMESGSLSATVAYYLAEIANIRGNTDLAQSLLTLALSQKANFPKRAAAVELGEVIEKQIKGPVKSDFDEPEFEETEPEDF